MITITREMKKTIVCSKLWIHLKILFLPITNIISEETQHFYSIILNEIYTYQTEHPNSLHSYKRNPKSKIPDP